MVRERYLAMWMSASTSSSFSKTLLLQMCFCVFGAGLFLPRVHPPAHVSEQGPCSPCLGAAVRGGARQARRARSPPGEGRGGRALGRGLCSELLVSLLRRVPLLWALCPSRPRRCKEDCDPAGGLLRRAAAWAGARRRRRLCALPLRPSPRGPPSSSEDCRVGNQARFPPERRPCLLTYKWTI